MPSILVLTPADRSRLGELSLLDDSQRAIFGPVPCFCKADNASAARFGNPTRDPERSHGDTPLGGFNAFVATPPVTFGPEYLKKYGPNPFIVLDPVSGQALRAKANGRHGLLIHGGDLTAAGKLRPTFGCVRVFNADMTLLLAKLPAGRFKVRVDPAP